MPVFVSLQATITLIDISSVQFQASIWNQIVITQAVTDIVNQIPACNYKCISNSSVSIISLVRRRNLLASVLPVTIQIQDNIPELGSTTIAFDSISSIINASIWSGQFSSALNIIATQHTLSTLQYTKVMKAFTATNTYLPPTSNPTLVPSGIPTGNY